LAFGAAVAGLLWFPALSWARSPQVQEPSAAVAPGDAAAALAQVPPGQAVVSYRSGELTIKARNAPLIDVLRSVCSQAGAVLEAPSRADERTFAIFGPGRASEVIASLLNGSQFGYAMAGSPDDPNALTRLIVIPGTKGSKAERQSTQPQVGSTPAAFIGETQADAESPAEAGGGSQRADGNAPDAQAVGSGASSPQVAQQAGAAGSDTAGAGPRENRPSPIRRRHRRR